jgi:MSHA pilin protein MshA
MRSKIRSIVSCPRSQGISFVELVVGVTVVGMLAAFAVPRFTHLENHVRASEVTTLSAKLRSAAAAAHAQYLRSGARLSSVTVEGRVVQLKNGYPDATSDGIQRAIVDASEFTATSTPTSVTYSKNGAPAAASCAVTYIASSAASIAASIADLNTSGC